ncbi:MAG: GNAT family N-acetyltransferase [Chitinophagales bacterium]
MFTLLTINGDENTNDPMFAEPECVLLISTYKIFYAEHGFTPPWNGYFILENARVIGSCGFAGPMKNNTVEIAYWTFKKFEGRGIASYACQALVEISRAQDPHVHITAKTEPRENASAHILRKYGFVQTKMVQDHEIGDAWLWELPPLVK